MHIRRLLCLLIAFCLIFTQTAQAYSLAWLPHNHQRGINRSTVGSINGPSTGSGQANLALTAKNNLTVSGSDLIATKDINLTAQNVTLDTGLDHRTSSESHDFKQSGLTVALSSPVLNAAQTVRQMSQAASKTKDKRMQALAGVSAGLASYNAYSKVGAGQALKDGNAADKAGGISVSVSLGNSSSHSESRQTSDQRFGASLAAGNNINISATRANSLAPKGGEGWGEGVNATDGNIIAVGSDINAGNNISLEADNAINLLAAQNTASQTSSNTGSSNSIGISFSLGKKVGYTLDIAASRARGNADGNDAGYSNTHVNAGNQLALKSGVLRQAQDGSGDLNIKGAVVSGKQIIADIGGNLNIVSLQDTSTYASQQSSAGFSVSIPIGAGTGGGSLSASKTNIDSNFKSVNEQSGFKAGDGGYAVNVNGDTTLVGGIIAASDTALQNNKTSFNTGGKLTQTDLINQSAYSAEGVGLSAGVGSNLGASGGIGQDSGNQRGITRSGIGVSTQANTNGSIKSNFDASAVTADVNAQVQITQTFSQVAPKAIADFAGNQAKDLREQAKTKPEGDPQKQALLDEAKKWDEGGTYRVILHTVSGALSGGLEGAAGAATSASAAPLLDDLQAQVKSELVKQGLSDTQATLLAQGLAQVTSAGMGAAVGGTQGTATALTVDTNNRQLDITETQRIKYLANGDPEKEARLTAAACALAHCADGVPKDAPAYAYLKGLQDTGASLTTEKNLLAAQTEWNGQGWDRLFQYSKVDEYLTDPLSQSKVGTRLFGTAQAFGGAVTTIGGAGIAAGGAVACPGSGVGCLVAAGGTAMTVYGYDMTKAGTSTAYTGNATLTYGEQVLQSLGMSPQTAGITYAMVGLSPAMAEAVAVNMAAKSTSEYNALVRAGNAAQAPAVGSTTEKLAVSEGAAASQSHALTTYLPQYDGFLGEGSDFVLIPGAKVDRVGFDGGTYLAPQGTPIPMRSLIPGTESRPYSVFEVMKPIDVQAGVTAPAFNQPGLGFQFVTNDSITELLKNGYLKRITP